MFGNFIKYYTFWELKTISDVPIENNQVSFLVGYLSS